MWALRVVCVYLVICEAERVETKRVPYMILVEETRSKETTWKT